jgi:hypothetical protein
MRRRASSAPPLNPISATGSGGLAAVVLSRVCPKGRDVGAPLTGSGRPPDNLAPGVRGEAARCGTSPGRRPARRDGYAWSARRAVPVSRNGGSPPACGKRGQPPGARRRVLGAPPRREDAAGRHPGRGPPPAHSPLRSRPWCSRLSSRASVPGHFALFCAASGLRPSAGVPKARP